VVAPNVDKLGLKDLLSLQRKLDVAIVEARSREKMEIKKKVAALASQHGFSVSELFGNRIAKVKSSSHAKYVNPDDPSDTWTARGRRPFWVIARLKKGAELSDFEI
jgi:DNA-binding protein H-NS